jgi:endo-1,4-beta-xylanase
MRFTNPTFKKANVKAFFVVLALVASNLMSCKSSLEEDLAPTATQTTTTTTETETATTTATNTQLMTYVSSATNFVAGKTLKGSFPFPIGTAVVKERLERTNYTDILLKDFNSITSEANMVFKAVHPEQDKWTFAKADAVVDFAIKNHVRIHGQTLLYPSDAMMPAFVKNFKGDKEAWKQLMKTHIQTVASRYKGRILAWDVLNEAVLDNGTFQNNIWFRNIGQEYLALAFKYAHEADPNAKLFYNDYGQEYSTKKMATILKMVSDFKAAGVQIDGLSFQMHTVLRVDVNTIKTMLAKASATGLQVYISELDVSVRYQKPDTFVLDAALAAQQGEKVKAIVQAYMTTVPKAQQYGITTWGIADCDTFWNVNYPNRDHDYPMLFDANYNPKPAYTGFLNAGLGK